MGREKEREVEKSADYPWWWGRDGKGEEQAGEKEVERRERGEGDRKSGWKDTGAESEDAQKARAVAL